ncbi:MAG: cyclase family protein [Candidatus Ozemobacteraceae bacterium]
MKPRQVAFFAFFLLSVTCVFGQNPGIKILDMTYPFSEKTLYWPTADKPFTLEKTVWKVVEGGWWYASNNYGACEHGGTHVDAPIHFGAKGRTIDQVPLEEWIGPAIKIDVSEKCSKNRDYLLTPDDIKDWEKTNGQVPAKAWVLMYTGIGTANYPDRLKTFGTEKTGAAALPELHFPGFSPESAAFLVKERNITGIGLDTPSIDFGQSPDFKVHQVICGAQKLGIENIANLDKLPASGAMLYPTPMLIKDGTGAPARIFAILP